MSQKARYHVSVINVFLVHVFHEKNLKKPSLVCPPHCHPCRHLKTYILICRALAAFEVKSKVPELSHKASSSCSLTSSSCWICRYCYLCPDPTCCLLPDIGSPWPVPLGVAWGVIVCSYVWSWGWCVCHLVLALQRVDSISGFVYCCFLQCVISAWRWMNQWNGFKDLLKAH